MIVVTWTMTTKRKAATGAVMILGLLSSFLVSIAVFEIASLDRPIFSSDGGRQLSSLDDSGQRSFSAQPGLSNYNFNTLRKSYYNAVYGGNQDTNSDIKEDVYVHPLTSSAEAPPPPLPSMTEIQRLHGSSHIPLSNSKSLANLKSARDPNDYAYLIIHYHKTGHDLSRSLRSLISQHFPGGPQSSQRENGFAPRYHHPVTNCPKNMNLNPGEIAVQAAPNLFCDAGVLAELMLDWRERREGLGTAGRRVKRGVKVVHLVRNPFTMAVSNFNYHAQYPTPENWVKSIDPCATELFNDHQTYPDLTLPTLLAPPPDPNTGSQPPPILTPDDFQSLSSTCRLHYRTRPRLKESSYYTHLRHLHPKYAVILSTIHMMTQGVSGGDILRMANNIIKLRQMTVLLQQMNALHHIPAGMEKIQVLTMSMDDFIFHPEENAKKLLDFFFDDDVMPVTTKRNIVTRYVQDYLVKLHAVEEEENGGDGGGGSVGPGVSGKDVDLSRAKADHITNTRRGGSNEELIGYLRQDEVVGRVLGRVEELVDVALRDGGNYGEYER